MAEFIEILSPSALKDLREANLEVVKLVANIDKVGQNMAKISTPSGSDNATKKLAQDYQELQKQLANTQKQLERNRLAEIKLAQDREKAFDKYERNLAKEQAYLTKANSLYNQTQQKVNQLTQTYNDLAIKKELGQNLTTKELTQLNQLTKEINIYQTALKKVDADIQKNQRNVGNYASGWNGLSNSINQLSREMPAFANSVQTGFMALSNNIPILFDEIERIKIQNKELIAQGQPVKSVFSQIAGAVLSWGTALSLGVTFLTLYGAKIWDSISGAKAKKEAIEAEKKALEEKQRVEEESLQTMVRYSAEEVSRSKILFENARNLNIPLKERVENIKELRERYPDYLKNLSDEQILAGDTALAEEELNSALIKRGYALGAQQLLQDNINKQLKAELELSRLSLALIETRNKAVTSANANEVVINRGLAGAQEQKAEAERKSTEKRITDLSNLINSLKEEQRQLLNTYNTYAEYLDVVKEEGKERNKNRADKREDIEALKLEEEKLKGLVQQLTALKSALEKQRAEESKSRAEYDDFTKSINAVERSIDGLTTGYKDLTQTGVNEFLNVYGKRAKQASENTEELEKALQSLFRTTANSTLSSFGMDSLIPMFDGTFNKMWETANTFNEKFAVGMKYIGDVAKETFAFISQQQQAQYEQQYQRLEQERDVALMFAGESATARQEIEEQYERRRVAIQRRQAQAQKKLAIFNTIINTAQGITSALAMTPPNVPLSIAIGVIGAVQTAMIASQQIPQFWKGTDDAPEGWAWTQEKGREIITDKQGRVKSTGSDKGAQLTYLNKGDKVYTASETESLMFNNSLNNMLLGSGIMMPKVEVSMDAEKITNEIKSLANTIANKPSFTLVKDAKGERVFMRKQAEVKEVLNARLNIQTYDV